MAGKKNKKTAKGSRKTARRKKEQGSFWRSLAEAVIFSMVPVILFYLMEFFDRNPFEQIRQEAQYFNILLFELIAWILYLLVGRARIALETETLLALIMGLINHYVMAFRSTPFVPWDIFSIGTAASVAEGYDFTPTGRVMLVVAGFAGIFILNLFLNFRLTARFWKRWLLMAALAAGLYTFAGMLQDSDFQTAHYLYPFQFTPGVMVKYDGYAVTFTMDLAYLVVDKPAGYNAGEAAELLDEYDKAAEDEAASVSGEDLPNIIVIMDEAFSDLSVLGELDTNQDYMPFVHSMQQGQENTISGYLNVSVCGGNTANTEFEFLTGNTMQFLPGGSIPYQQYINSDTPSLARWLEELGYVTYAQHPYYGSGWERETVYPYLGFENLSFLPDYTDRSIIRTYVSDETCFDKIISTYENKEAGKPAFIFNVTMQNHGGYTDTYADFTNDVYAEGLNNEALDQYLSLLKITDADLEELISYFEAQDEKTVIVFFGDHQPSDTVARSVLSANGMDYQNLSEEETQLRYQVPYLIWANYDIQEETGADTSANYLSARVLQAAGVPTDGYQNFLLQLEEEYPILSAARTEVNEDAQEDTSSGLLEEYEKLQYYQLFDWSDGE